jgi:hypothetical protein
MSELFPEFDEIFAKLRVLSIVATPLSLWIFMFHGKSFHANGDSAAATYGCNTFWKWSDPVVGQFNDPKSCCNPPTIAHSIRGAFGDGQADSQRHDATVGIIRTRTMRTLLGVWFTDWGSVRIGRPRGPDCENHPKLSFKCPKIHLEIEWMRSAIERINHSM